MQLAAPQPIRPSVQIVTILEEDVEMAGPGGLDEESEVEIKEDERVDAPIFFDIVFSEESSVEGEIFMRMLDESGLPISSSCTSPTTTVFDEDSIFPASCTAKRFNDDCVSPIGEAFDWFFEHEGQLKYMRC